VKLTGANGTATSIEGAIGSRVADWSSAVSAMSNISNGVIAAILMKEYSLPVYLAGGNLIPWS
jgi:hypothetical protein